MKPAPFTYHRASSVRDAVDLLAELADGEPKLLAGGQSLVAMMNYRMARPGHLVDLTHVPGLDGIQLEGPTLRIGALATHRAVEKADLGPGFAVLSATMRWVGHLPIRTRGTVGGSLAHADATAEWCLLAVLLDALVIVDGPGGRREIAAREFFHGPFTTALDPDEVIVEVAFGRPAPRAAVAEYADRRGDFAVVAAGVDLDTGDVVLGGVAPVPLLVRGAGSPDEVADALELRDEPGVPAAYRRGLVSTLVARAREEAACRA
ncbi:FAD binding domain-containing protein [Pseudonocardia endophytica]|uniref:Carbon-monoxide dehydrogenase medium subunit n=1 Tax=Pseudonocardia endophytica TaxID=401976 RepID=A0A4R1HXB8_PSEEN|nr:FAD binding domain-containing protein [Pseudonocardia endophytica]TCK26143.1 carbon-monoxide dehydrogenase medium subunit [Pseudonocardia endophytica]